MLCFVCCSVSIMQQLARRNANARMGCPAREVTILRYGKRAAVVTVGWLDGCSDLFNEFLSEFAREQ